MSGLGLASLAFAFAPQDVASAVEREWRIREWALSSERWSAAREAAFAGETAPEDRAAWIEALARGAQSGAWSAGELAVGDTVARGLTDSAPQVRIAAMEALAALLARGERGLAAETVTAAKSQGALLPSERLACVAVLARSALPASAAPVLAPLAADADARVARAARDALLARLGEPDRSVVDLWRATGPAVELVEALERSAPSGARLDALEAELAEAERARWLAALEALRMRWHGSGAVEPIVSAWPMASFEPLARRAAQAARVRRPELGRALYDMVAEHVDDGSYDHFLHGAVLGLEADEVVRRASADPGLARFPALRGELWEALRGQSAAWRVETVRPWLALESSPDVRKQVVVTLRDCAGGDPDGATRELLELALEDPEPRISGLAFEALASARELERSLRPLFAAWSRADRERRVVLLAELPRDVEPAPFRAALIQLAENDGPARAQAIELLAAFGPDAELAARCERWLYSELGSLERAPAAERRALELRAMGAVRALHKLAGGAALDAMEVAARRIGPSSDDVGKLCIWSLGQTEAGRARLPAWLAQDAPSRLRIEAELALAPVGSPEAIAWLARDFARCDWELKGRALRACAALGDRESFAFLARAAADRALDPEQRQLAVETLAARGEQAVDALVELVRCGDLELERVALESLGSIGGERATATVLAELAEADLGLARGGGEAERALVHRDAALVALARARCDDPRALAAWLARPMAAAAGDLERRFRGESSPAAEFAWRAELAYGAALAARGDLDRALDASGAWWRLDSRLLAALGERALAAGSRDTARRLLEAALVAFEGEAPTEPRESERFGVRCRLLDLAANDGEWGAVATHASTALADWRAGRASDRALERALGAFDPVREVDPAAALETARCVALGRVALARGDFESAARLEVLARDSVGFSAHARALAHVFASALADGK